VLWKNTYYFDSYGIEPLESLQKYIKYYNEYRVQKLGTDTCGLYCIYVIDELNKGRDYINILTDFDPVDFNKNERFIKSKYNVIS